MTPTGRVRTALIAAAAVVLALSGILTYETQRCAAEGGRFSLAIWRCTPAVAPIILRRSIERI